MTETKNNLDLEIIKSLPEKLQQVLLFKIELEKESKNNTQNLAAEVQKS